MAVKENGSLEGLDKDISNILVEAEYLGDKGHNDIEIEKHLVEIIGKFIKKVKAN